MLETTKISNKQDLDVWVHERRNWCFQFAQDGLDIAPFDEANPIYVIWVEAESNGHPVVYWLAVRSIGEFA